MHNVYNLSHYRQTGEITTVEEQVYGHRLRHTREMLGAMESVHKAILGVVFATGSDVSDPLVPMVSRLIMTANELSTAIERREQIIKGDISRDL